MEKLTLGYVRVSSQHQQILRQIKNIKQYYPDAIIIKDHYTGTKLDRPGFARLLQMCRGKYLPKGKIVGKIVFDEVSRMSRNEIDGYNQYMEFYNMGIELVFLKEPQLNTETYRQAMQKCINLKIDTGDKATDEFVKSIGDALNTYTLELACQQIKSAFGAAQRERDYLSQRTKEGLQIARLYGKQIGRIEGTTVTTKKYLNSKEKILKYYNKLGGELTAQQIADICHISRSTLYTYIKRMDKEGLIKRGDNGIYLKYDSRSDV